MIWNCDINFLTVKIFISVGVDLGQETVDQHVVRHLFTTSQVLSLIYSTSGQVLIQNLEF